MIAKNYLKIRMKFVFNKVEKWCEEAGGNITITYPQKEPKAVATPIDDSNPFWTPFVNAVEQL